MNYFMIPGNPPAVHFYERWGEEIAAERPGVKVAVSHYPDLSVSGDSAAAMQVVLEAHLAQLREFRKEAGAQVTLIGHSLGAHFALQLLARAPELVGKAVLVHPFLRRPSARGRFTLRAVGSLSRHPRLQNGVLRCRTGLERIFTDLPHVTDDEILRSIQLAHHESATLARDRTPIRIPSELSERVIVFHTALDIWCTRQAVAELRTQVRVHECTEPHGFVTAERHRRSLFHRILAAHSVNRAQ